MREHLKHDLSDDLSDDLKQALAEMQQLLKDAGLQLLLPAEVNDCRHRWLHLFTRYMMFWRLAHVSFDVFFAIDFPGKSRVTRTIEVLEPLDEANLRIVLQDQSDADNTEWSKGWPEVYRFLRVWLVAMGADEIPNRIRVGGQRSDDFYKL